IDEGCPMIHGGYISQSESWFSNVEHLVVCDVYVNNDATLYLPAGTTVKFALSRRMYVGTNGNGNIIISGTPDNRVTFTSALDAPYPGAWRGVTLGDGAWSSSIDGLLIEYSYRGTGNLYLYYNQAPVRNSIVRHSAGIG